MLVCSEKTRVAFNLDEINPSGSAEMLSRTKPAQGDVDRVRDCLQHGEAVALISGLVDDVALTMHCLKKKLPETLPEPWFERISRDMEMRIYLSQWCLDNFGFVLPISNVRPPGIAEVLPGTY